MPSISPLKDEGQLVLPLIYDEDSLRDYLQRASGKDLTLVITDNSTSIIAVKTKGITASVRLHGMFFKAGLKVIDEIAGFIKNRRRKTPLIRNFIRQNSFMLKERPPKRATLKTGGKCHDLLELYKAINNEYFGDRVSALITWGTKGLRHEARRRTLGSYNSRTKTIRINPALDKKTVPGYFVGYIVYHEMLHADMGTENKNGRRSIHSKEFRKRERLFKDYEKALAWEKNRYIMEHV